MSEQTTPTPRTDEIISVLEAGLQVASELTCKCGSIESEFGCRACSAHTRTINEATKSIATLERELAARIDDNRLMSIEYHKEIDELRTNLTQLQAVAFELAKYGDKLNEKHSDYLHLLIGHALDCDCERCEAWRNYRKWWKKYTALPDNVKGPTK